MILHCPHCGIKVAPSTQDCPGCARRMVRPCPHCSEQIAATASTCKYCGEGAATSRPPAPEPGIQFIEDSKPAPKKKRCCRKLLMALTLLAGIAAAGLFVKTNCQACVKVAGHKGSSLISSSECKTSHCGRVVCRKHKTPLWISVVEKLSGKICWGKTVPEEYKPTPANKEY